MEPVWHKIDATAEDLLADLESAKEVLWLQLQTWVDCGVARRVIIRKMTVDGTPLPCPPVVVVNRRLKKGIRKHDQLPDGLPFTWVEIPLLSEVEKDKLAAKWREQGETALAEVLEDKRPLLLSQL
jgi:hypothetical protein